MSLRLMRLYTFTQVSTDSGSDTPLLVQRSLLLPGGIIGGIIGPGAYRRDIARDSSPERKKTTSKPLQDFSLDQILALWLKNILSSQTTDEEEGPACSDTCSATITSLCRQIHILRKDRDEERAAKDQYRVALEDSEDRIEELETAVRDLREDLEDCDAEREIELVAFGEMEEELDRVEACLKETKDKLEDAQEELRLREGEFPGEPASDRPVEGYKYIEGTLKVPAPTPEQVATEEELAAAVDDAEGDPQTVPGDQDYQAPLIDTAQERVPVVDVDIVNGRQRFRKPGNLQWISSLTRLAQILECQEETRGVWPKGSVDGVAVSYGCLSTLVTVVDSC